MRLVVRLGLWSSFGESAVEEEYVYEPVGAKRRPSKVPPPLYRRPEL